MKDMPNQMIVASITHYISSSCGEENDVRNNDKSQELKYYIITVGES